MLNERHQNASDSSLGMDIDVGRAAFTLTKALDYVGIDDKSHGRRVGLICHRIAHYLGWEREKRHFSLLAGMLHDCGVSSTTVHQKLVDEMEWTGAEEHCLRGHFFLNSFSPFKPYAETVLYHHTRWENIPSSIDAQTQEYANLIFLSDRLDVAYATYNLNHPGYQVLLDRNLIIDQLRPFVGTLFSEHLFNGLEKAARKDSFWMELRDEYLDDAITEALSSADYKVSLCFDQVESLAELISQIVDAKSPFTHYHSLRVADLAYELAELVGYDEEHKRVLRIAGLLHDVGKLRTPDEILEKTTGLSVAERAQIHSHPLDSKLVLKSIFPNSPIAKWASEHHERLDGSGYPYGWRGEQIDMPTRILCIADIFQALCQKRPYRDRLDVDEVLIIMDKMISDGQLDSDVYGHLKENQKSLYQTATREG